MSLKELIINRIRGKGLTMNQAAQKLNIARTTLYAKVSEAEIDKEFEQNVRTILNIDINELRNELTASTIKPKSKEQLEAMLSNFGGSVSEDDTPYITEMQDLRQLANRYKAWFDNPPLSPDLYDFYRTLAIHTTHDKLFAYLLSNVDMLKEKIQ